MKKIRKKKMKIMAKIVTQKTEKSIKRSAISVLRNDLPLLKKVYCEFSFYKKNFEKILIAP